MTKKIHRIKSPRAMMLGLLFMATGLIFTHTASAEFGDIVINNYSDKADMRPVIFSHWFHRIRFRCKICHADLGFKPRAGANKMNMLKLINGEYCGACHNGEVAWSLDNCELCHTAIPGTPTQVHESTSQVLARTVGRTNIKK